MENAPRETHREAQERQSQALRRTEIHERSIIMAKKVLIIDDEPDMLNVIQFALKKAGYEVATCNSGGNAWNAIAQGKPDLVLLDVMLPGIDGYSLGIKISQDESTKD